MIGLQEMLTKELERLKGSSPGIDFSAVLLYK